VVRRPAGERRDVAGETSALGFRAPARENKAKHVRHRHPIPRCRIAGRSVHRRTLECSRRPLVSAACMCWTWSRKTYARGDPTVSVTSLGCCWLAIRSRKGMMVSTSTCTPKHTTRAPFSPVGISLYSSCEEGGGQVVFRPELHLSHARSHC
jgi:hypothetical protein